MTCPHCTAKDKRIALLERDLEAAQQAVTHFEQKWLAAVEGTPKKEKENALQPH